MPLCSAEILEEFGRRILTANTELPYPSLITQATMREVGRLFWALIEEIPVVEVGYASDAENNYRMATGTVGATNTQQIRVNKTQQRYLLYSEQVGPQLDIRDLPNLPANLVCDVMKAESSVGLYSLINSVFSEKHHNSTSVLGNQLATMATVYHKLTNDKKYVNLFELYKKYVAYDVNPGAIPREKLRKLLTVLADLTKQATTAKQDLRNWFLARSFAIKEPPSFVSLLRKKLPKDVTVRAFFQDLAKEEIVDIVCQAQSKEKFDELEKFFQPVRSRIQVDEKHYEVIVRGSNVNVRDFEFVHSAVFTADKKEETERVKRAKREKGELPLAPHPRAIDESVRNTHVVPPKSDNHKNAKEIKTAEVLRNMQRHQAADKNTQEEKQRKKDERQSQYKQKQQAERKREELPEAALRKQSEEAKAYRLEATVNQLAKKFQEGILEDAHYLEWAKDVVIPQIISIAKNSALEKRTEALGFLFSLLGQHFNPRRCERFAGRHKMSPEFRSFLNSCRGSMDNKNVETLIGRVVKLNADMKKIEHATARATVFAGSVPAAAAPTAAQAGESVRLRSGKHS